MNNDTQFLSCDWGTTAFRLRLVAAEGFKILAESSSKQGNTDTNEAWLKEGKDASGRTAFYLKIIQDYIAKLKEKAPDMQDDIPLIISGMASSNIGMLELPYKDMPFALDGSDLATKLIAPTSDFTHPVLLISGVKTAEDVMRGEETQVVGCSINAGDEEQLVIHPGTHSKHIVLKAGQAVSFKTYMTGELFSNLSTKSILAASVGENGDFDHPANAAAFEQGVKDGASQNLLNALFHVRTNDLFKRLNKTANRYYLSGLLIGYELMAFPKDFTGNIILAGEAALVAYYKTALQYLGIIKRAANLVIKDADEITLAGQYAVYRHHSKNAPPTSTTEK